MGITEHIQEFEEYLRSYYNLEESTIKKYKSTIRRFLMETNMKFGLAEINKFILKYNTGQKRQYHHKTPLKIFVKFIGKKDWEDKIVRSKMLPRKKQYPFIGKLKMTNIINSLPSKFRRIAFLQYKMGTRVSETLTIQIENIDYNSSEELIYIRLGSFTKRRQERHVRLDKKYSHYLKKWCNGRNYGFLFLTDVGTSNEDAIRKSVQNFVRYYNEALSKAGKERGIENLSSHYMRRLFANNFLKAGGNIVYLQSVLGHKDIKSTMRYISIADEEADKVITKIG